MFVEEMAEGPVAGIVEKRRYPEQCFEERERKMVAEGRMEVTGETTCDVHGSERVGKPCVFGRGKDEAGALKLVDRTKALDPRMVDQMPFTGSGSVLRTVDKRKISMNGI
jgi:hypothetical protein